MKIMFLFCDMLRSNMLRTINPKIQSNTLIDEWLIKLGGTSYINCFTPSPDTPRSLACLYTGLYPKHNGCEKRTYWPKYYLKSNYSTLFDILLENKYKLISYIIEVNLKVGFLPQHIENHIENYTTLQQAVDASKQNLNQENLFLFFNLEDYHWAVDASNNDAYTSNYEGQNHLSECFNIIFSKLCINNFDYIFIFSDHGCQFSNEKYAKQCYKLYDDRTRILMFLHKKNDIDIIKKYELTSILDVFPTIQQILSVKPFQDSDGESLFELQNKRFIVFEDHGIFKPILESPHDLWAYRDKDVLYLESLLDSEILKINDDSSYSILNSSENIDLESLKEKIDLYSCSYSNNKKQYEILQYYDLLTREAYTRELYSDGQKIVRVINHPKIIAQLKIKFKNYIIKKMHL